MGLWARHANAKLPSEYAASTPEPSAGAAERGRPATQGADQVRRERVAELLVAGLTVREIAATVGVHPQTAYRLARDPEVVASIRATFEQRRNAAARELDAGTFEAVRYLRKVLGDEMATTKERIRCAVELLDRGGIPRGVKLDIHNNDTGTSIEIDDVSALSDEQIEAAARVALERRARIKITP